MSGIRLTAIEIEGFRVFQAPLKISFLSPTKAPVDVLIVAGPNGTGKTSLLEAIVLAMGRESLIRESLVAEVSRGHWRAEVPETASIVLSFNVASAPGTEFGPYAPCDVVLRRSSTEWRLSLVVGDGLQALQDQLRDSFVQSLSMEYLSSWRGAFQFGGVRAGAVEIPRDERYRYFRLKQRIIDERAARGFSRRETRETDWLERLNDVWHGWHDRTSTRIDALETGDPDRPFDLFIVEDGEFGAQPVCPLDMASSGELEWVTIAGALIVSEFRGLLLIDEPELHLHPQWQARLLPTLRKLAPEAQLILATHSGYPWDQALPFQRVLLLPPGDSRLPTDAVSEGV